MTSPARYRFLGTTDECVECQQCGKIDLRSTVVLEILDAEGNVEDVTYYGSTCAARALGIRGGGRAARQQAESANQRTRQAAADARAWLHAQGADDDGRFADHRAAVRAYAARCIETCLWAHRVKGSDAWAAAFDEVVTVMVGRLAEAKRLDPRF